MAWLSLVAILGLPQDADFEAVCVRLSTAASTTVAAAQFIVIGSDEYEDGFVATGIFDIVTDGPSLHRLYGAAGGSTHR